MSKLNFKTYENISFVSALCGVALLAASGRSWWQNFDETNHHELLESARETAQLYETKSKETQHDLKVTENSVGEGCVRIVNGYSGVVSGMNIQDASATIAQDMLTANNTVCGGNIENVRPSILNLVSAQAAHSQAIEQLRNGEAAFKEATKAYELSQDRTLAADTGLLLGLGIVSLVISRKTYITADKLYNEL
jgi:hypothetical protein